MKNIMTLIAMIALIVTLVVAGPLLVIWALNTLFPVLAIQYTIWTWLAALILGAAVGPNIKYKR